MRLITCLLTNLLRGATVLVELWPPHVFCARFRDSNFLQGGVVSPTPNLKGTMRLHGAIVQKAGRTLWSWSWPCFVFRTSRLKISTRRAVNMTDIFVAFFGPSIFFLSSSFFPPYSSICSFFFPLLFFSTCFSPVYSLYSSSFSMS
jgi:hypothetical protein